MVDLRDLTESPVRDLWKGVKDEEGRREGADAAWSDAGVGGRA